MQISTGNTQASRGQCLIPVVVPHRGRGQLDLVIANLPLERTGRLIVADADNIFFLDIPGQVFRSNAYRWQR